MIWPLSASINRAMQRADDAHRLAAPHAKAHGRQRVHAPAGATQQATARAVALAQRIDAQHHRLRAEVALGAGREAGHRGQQRSGVVGLGMVQHLLSRPLLDQAAVLHHGDAVGNLGHHAEVMGDEDHPHALLALQFADQRQDLRLRGDVQRGGGLVGDQDVGLQRKRHRDHRALALAARQLVRVGLQDLLRVGQVHRGQQFQHARTAGSAVTRAVDLQHLVDLRTDAQHRVQRRHRLLKDHRDAVAAQVAQPLGRGLQQVFSFEQDAPGTGLHMA
jgi:hypothetical protein